jgi:hypothetical protein
LCADRPSRYETSPVRKGSWCKFSTRCPNCLARNRRILSNFSKCLCGAGVNRRREAKRSGNKLTNTARRCQPDCSGYKASFSFSRFQFSSWPDSSRPAFFFAAERNRAWTDCGCFCGLGSENVVSHQPIRQDLARTAVRASTSLFFFSCLLFRAGRCDRFFFAKKKSATRTPRRTARRVEVQRAGGRAFPQPPRGGGKRGDGTSARPSRAAPGTPEGTEDSVMRPLAAGARSHRTASSEWTPTSYNDAFCSGNHAGGLA